MKAALYARVSTANKDQNPETQLVPLREFVQSQRWETCREWVDYAPANDLLHRTGWSQLLEDASKRRFDRLLVWRMDRAFRSVLDAAREAGKLLEDLPALWGEANLAEWRNLLLSMLDAVYVDTVEEKSIVAIRPKPALRPLFEIATTREGSGVVLINETPPELESSEAYGPCFWWRRGSPQLSDNNPVFIAEERWGAMAVG